MAQPEIKALYGDNVAAFLDMLAFAEGTDNGRQETRNQGYDVLVGGSLFTDYRDHPRRLIKLKRYDLFSSAAGRYQFIRKTWDALQQKLELPDFSPLSQDKACVEKLKERMAFSYITQGRIHEAIVRAQKEWASLPGAGYGQHEQSFATLLNVYQQKGGELHDYSGV